VADEIHNLGGLRKEEIENRDLKIWSDVNQNKAELARLNNTVFGNGRPALERLANDYTDRQIKHLKGNTQQDCLELRAEMKEGEKKASLEIDKVTKKMDRNMWLLVASLAGIVVDLIHGFAK
jgi:hypothetical protein